MKSPVYFRKTGFSELLFQKDEDVEEDIFADGFLRQTGQNHFQFQFDNMSSTKQFEGDSLNQKEDEPLLFTQVEIEKEFEKEIQTVEKLAKIKMKRRLAANYYSQKEVSSL